MSYALIEDGNIVSVGLPTVGTLPDGSQVSGFDKLEPEILSEMGYVPIEDLGRPTHDPETQIIELEYQVSDDKVTVVYTVQDKPEPEPEPEPVASTQEQLDALIDKLVAKGTLTVNEVIAVRRPTPKTPPTP